MLSLTAAWTSGLIANYEKALEEDSRSRPGQEKPGTGVKTFTPAKGRPLSKYEKGVERTFELNREQCMGALQRSPEQKE